MSDMTSERVNRFIKGPINNAVTYTGDWAEGNLEYADVLLMLHWHDTRGSELDVDDREAVWQTARDVLDNYHRGFFDPIDIRREDAVDIIALVTFMAALRICRQPYTIERG